MKQQIFRTSDTILMALILAALLGYAAYDYLNLPIVAVNQHDECEWIQIAPDFEKRTCPLILPSKYEKQYVWFDNSISEDAPHNVWEVTRRARIQDSGE